MNVVNTVNCDKFHALKMLILVQYKFDSDQPKFLDLKVIQHKKVLDQLLLQNVLIQPNNFIFS
jgi:hypothetical protein